MGSADFFGFTLDGLECTWRACDCGGCDAWRGLDYVGRKQARALFPTTDGARFFSYELVPAT